MTVLQTVMDHMKGVLITLLELVMKLFHRVSQPCLCGQVPRAHWPDTYNTIGANVCNFLTRQGL